MSKIYQLHTFTWELCCNLAINIVCKQICIKNIGLGTLQSCARIKVFDLDLGKLFRFLDAINRFFPTRSSVYIAMFFESQVILLSILSKEFKAISDIFPSWWLEAGIKHLQWPLCISLINIKASHVWNLLLNNVHCELVDRVVAVACHDIRLILKFDSLGYRWNPILKVVSKITSSWWIDKACSERSYKLIGHSWSIGWLTCTE